MGDDLTESGESGTQRRSGPRTSVVLLVTLAIALVLGGGAVGAVIWMDRSGDSDAEVAATTTANGTIDVEPIGGGTANRLFARRTEAGVDIRVHETDDPMIAADFGAPPDAPEWCKAESMASATAVSAAAVAQTELPVSGEAPPSGAFNPMVGGRIEGAPLYGVLGQVEADVTMARLSITGGGQDSMEPVDGFIALAVPGPQTDDANAGPMVDPWAEAMRVISVELLRADGSSERLTGQSMMDGGLGAPIWNNPACFGEDVVADTIVVEPETTPPLTLPPAGPAQPPDPAAAQAEITRAFDELHADIGNWDTLIRLVDDPSGLDLLIERESVSGRRKILGTTVVISELVFFSPIEASFIYVATIDGDEQDAEYGRARLIEGTWRITRTTVCQDIAKARNGIDCPI